MDQLPAKAGKKALGYPPELYPSVAEQIDESLSIHKAFQRDCAESIARISWAVAQCLLSGGKVLIFGNGGSAADAQHIAAELVGRYRLERRPMPALALTVNSSTVTAIANDYGLEEVFARQVAALATEKDITIGISTSGNSRNVLRGIFAAREMGSLTVGMTGNRGGDLAKAVDLCLSVPSDSTARIQECHILAGHIISELCERMLVEGVATNPERN